MGVRMWAMVASVALAVAVWAPAQQARAEARCPLSGQPIMLFDGETIDPQQDKKLLQSVAGRAKAASVCVIAHVDSTGDPTYTRRMAVKRAMYVVDELAELGVPRERMMIEMRAIEGDVRKSADRRVEVVVGR